MPWFFLRTSARSLRHEQLFVLIDIERVDRGLPPVVGMVAQLNTDAQNAAAANTDPTPSSVPPGSTVLAWASNWAEAAGPFGSDYNWMYDDGPGPGNLGCTTGHSRFVLGPPRQRARVQRHPGRRVPRVLVMGAAEATVAIGQPLDE